MIIKLDLRKLWNTFLYFRKDLYIIIALVMFYKFFNLLPMFELAVVEDLTAIAEAQAIQAEAEADPLDPSHAQQL